MIFWSPLIISGPVPKGEQEYVSLSRKISQLSKEINYALLNEAKSKIAKSEQEGVDKRAKKLYEEVSFSFRSCRGLPKNKS